jgi:hypothetical protein
MKKYKRLHFILQADFFYLRGSFESPVWVPDGCEIPNMRPLLVYEYTVFPGNSIKWLWISRLSSSISHQDFSSLWSVPQIPLWYSTCRSEEKIICRGAFLSLQIQVKLNLK